MSTRLTELIAGTGCEQRRADISARDEQGKRDVLATVVHVVSFKMVL